MLCITLLSVGKGTGWFEGIFRKKNKGGCCACFCQCGEGQGILREFSAKLRNNYPEHLDFFQPGEKQFRVLKRKN